jgi:undecaprenyl-diphosphatase
MTVKVKKRYFAAIITGALFVALIVLLKSYDVAQVGPDGKSIGFSTINTAFHERTGVNMKWYEITDYLGYFAIGVCMIFALAGLVQLIKRRSLFKVDRDILALGCLFAVVIGFYVLFEKVVINYRPIIMPGETAPEASFPSSHTMLIITVMAAVMLIIDDYAGWGLSTITKMVCVVTAAVTVGGRLYCGVHWLTDIIGGILLSATLLFIFSAVISSGSNTLPSASSSDKKGPGRGKGGSGRNPKLSERDRVIDGYRCKH